MQPSTRSRRSLVVQLFNPSRFTKQKPTDSREPLHLRHQHRLEAAGFEMETISAYGFPWNPFRRSHYTYQGLDLLRALRVILTRRSAALVCAHMESALFVVLLKKVFGFSPPVVIWEVPWSPGWRFREMVAKLAIPRADGAVVFGSNQIELLQNAYGKDLRIFFIPFYVDVDFFKPMETHQRDVPTVFSCGMDAGRDFDVLLRATAGLDLQVKIKAGEPIACDPARHPNVSILRGFLPDEEFRQLYADASIIVVSTKETVNAGGVTSLLEALAMGKPVIVSDNPALRDYLPPADAGIVVPIGDDKALRAAILDLASNPAKAAAMGRKAREFAVERFSARNHYTAMADMFKAVIANAKARPAPRTQ